jgi:hypothetical protein
MFIDILSGDSPKKSHKVFRQSVVGSIVVFVRIDWSQGGWSQCGREMNLAHRANECDDFDTVCKLEIFFSDSPSCHTT